MGLSSLPTLDLTMNKNEWNKVFAFGTNIYRTYSSQLPILDNNNNNKNLATKNLTATNITIEPEETDQTIADNVIRTWVKQIHGVENKTTLYSNIATINTEIDTLLTGNDSNEYQLVYKLKEKLNNANGLTDTNTTINICRTLKTMLETDSSSSSRLSSNSGKIYHVDNILSNLVGDLSNLVSGQTNGTYTSSNNISFSNTGNGSGGILSSITILGGEIVGIKFSSAGSNYAAGDVLTFSATGVTFSNTYTLVAGDIDNNGGFSNNLYYFLFESGDSIIFQLTINPTNTIPNQTSKNYAIKITMS
tara:strand:- start:21774 stop:22688 length:915 start_codon:yes stop_codon:yes gene_type:complete